MTIEELIRRVHLSDPVTVLNSIANDPDEAQSFVRTIGPWALQHLTRDAERKGGLVAPSGGSKQLAPRGEWTIREWKRRESWLQLFAKGVNRELEFNRRVVKAFGKDKTLTSMSPELRARLSAEDVAHLDALCGAKRLAA